jgi:hypothetical protein
MHSTIVFSALAAALSSNVLAAPLQVRSDGLILADTVQFIAKTIGENPNPTGLPDINNWHFTPVHSGAGLNAATITDPSKPFNLSAPGFFRNGTDEEHGEGGYISGGFLDTKEAWSLVLNMVHDKNSPNPGAAIGQVQFNIGEGTSGFDVYEGRLITSRYVTDAFWACPNVRVEASDVIAVVATDRYEEAPEGCWAIELVAQCAGAILDSDKAAFPEFVQTECYPDADFVRVSQL